MKVELTKQQRNEVYKYALNLFVEKYDKGHLNGRGMCYFIYDAIRDILSSLNEDEKDSINPYDERIGFIPFPEILKHKPNIMSSQYWFNNSDAGNSKRIKILQQAIEETN